MPIRNTRSRDIFGKLADDVVTGRIAPGQKLDEQAIARQFNVSRTPVREAIRQLSGTGLVEALPRGGFAAARIDEDQLAGMFETLGELEGLCAKHSALRMSEVERQKLKILQRDCEQAAAESDFARFTALNERFHQTIYGGTHNASLQQLTLGFRQRLAPFRVPPFYVIGERVRSSLREHREIVDAISRCDGDQAFQAMRVHTASTSVNVIEYFQKLRAGLVREAPRGVTGKPLAQQVS